jgi:diguanylate cyclase (GGDEF)-like protein
MQLPKINISPVIKISIGLTSLIVAWMILMDIFVGLWPDQTTIERELRIKTSESLAYQTAMLLQAGDIVTLEKMLLDAINDNTKIKSIAIRKIQGQIILQAGNHQRFWTPTSENKSTPNFIHIPIKTDQQLFGNLEIAFQSTSPRTFAHLIVQPQVLSLFLLAIGGIALYSLYLRKTFVYLDPSSVIPDRVSLAFDSFSEGVMMVDKTGRVVLANKILTAWTGDQKLFGKLGKDITWLRTSLRENPKNYPWMKSMETQEAIKGIQIEFQNKSGEVNKAILNCSPILDAANKVRGCIVTLDNVTELDRINKELTLTMEKLYRSQNEIEKQNTELVKLASRDPLTNCLNRRAFFESAEKVFNHHQKNKLTLSCIMTDIDHFKRFNDQYGHAIGDKVLIAFSRTLNRSLRIDDLLTRYGGEEFCILLPDTASDTASVIAERMRNEVELNAGQTIRSTQEIKITSSFGVSTLTENTLDLLSLIDQADQALYDAKKSGRNCVKVWDGIKTEL